MTAPKPRFEFDPSKPLSNEKHEKFCGYIIAGQPADTAFELAGFAPHKKNAARLRRHPKVDARINYLLSLRHAEIRAEDEPLRVESEPLSITPSRQYVIGRLVEQIEIAMGKRLVKLRVRDRRGKHAIIETEVNMFNQTAANKALELLGREVGLFEGGSAPQDDKQSARSGALANVRGDFDKETLRALLRLDEPDEPEAKTP